MVLCTVIYMRGRGIGHRRAAGGRTCSKSAEPLALALLRSQPSACRNAGGERAIVAFPTVIMVFMYGQSRIFFVMARDGLLPRTLARVSAEDQARRW